MKRPLYLRDVAGLLVFVVLGTILVGCVTASSPIKKRETAVEQTKEQPKVQLISGESNDSSTDIVIAATAPFRYTTFKLNNPQRIAIEIRNISYQPKEMTIAVEDKLVGAIKVIKFPKANAIRVEVGVKVPCLYDAVLQGHVLTLNLSADPDSAVATYQRRLAKAKKQITDLQSQIENKPQAPRRQHLADPDQAAIRTMITNWLRSWRAKDISTYRSFYTDSFKSGDQTLATWLSKKEKTFATAGPITIEIEEVSLTIDEEWALVEFYQQYHSGNHSDIGVKTIELTQIDDNWKIANETWSALR